MDFPRFLDKHLREQKVLLFLEKVELRGLLHDTNNRLQRGRGRLFWR